MVASIFAGSIGGSSGPPLILDETPSAAAFSTRRLRSAYTGPLIRVRRTSDDAELDIGYGGDNWLNEAALVAHVGASNGVISAWYDQSGNARHALQTVLVSQPTIATAGVVETNASGRPEVVFVAESAGVVLTGIPVDFALSVVGAPKSSATFRSLGTDASAAQHYLLMSGGSPEVSTWEGNSFGNVAGTWADDEVATWLIDNTRVVNANGQLGKNGAATVDTNRTFTGPAVSLGNNTAGGQPFGGINEAIFFSSLSAGQRDSLEADQGTAYTITIV